MCKGMIRKEDAAKIHRALPTVPPWHVRNTLQKYLCNAVCNKGKCDGEACRELIPIVEQKLRDWQSKESEPLQWGALIRVSKQAADEYNPRIQEEAECHLPAMFQIPV